MTAKPEELIKKLYETDEKVCRAACAWWDEKRPAGWSLEKHVADPTVNCSTGTEKELAIAVAALVIDTWTTYGRGEGLSE